MIGDNDGIVIRLPVKFYHLLTGQMTAEGNFRCVNMKIDFH